LSTEEKPKWIDDYIDSDIAGVRKPIEHAEAVIHQEKEDTRNNETAGLTNTEPKQTFQEMMVAIGESLCNLV
jgi:hypothetical protein